MKIKLAILDSNQTYLDRISAVFSNNYSDKLEIYSFTQADVFKETVSKNKIDVLLVGESFDLSPDSFPRRHGFAYLVETADVVRLKDQPAICKYQKASRIYKQVLGIFSEKVADGDGYQFGSASPGNILAFFSASGGTGSTTLAVACAKNFARRGKKTLYINIEQFGSAETFFSGEGGTDFGTLIPCIQNQKIDLALKLESEVRQDACGVHFYHSPKNAWQMCSLSDKDLDRLFTALKTSSYKFIILDADFALDAKTMVLCRHAAKMVFVSDGSEIANRKIAKAFGALEQMEEKLDLLLVAKIRMAYNKFSNKVGKTVEGTDVRELGGAPSYKYATSNQIVEQLTDADMFDKLYKEFMPKSE